MDPNIRREIILDNYQNPLNRGLVDDSNSTYITPESCCYYPFGDWIPGHQALSSLGGQ